MDFSTPLEVIEMIFAKNHEIVSIYLPEYKTKIIQKPNIVESLKILVNIDYLYLLHIC